jgi:hypothetical protein
MSKKGTPIVDHTTFSLLPFQLIPYKKYSIVFIFNLLQYLCENNKSIHEVQTHYTMAKSEVKYIDLSATLIIDFMEEMLQAISKLLVSGYYQDAEKSLQDSEDCVRMGKFILFAIQFQCCFIEPSINGIIGLSFDYYLKGGGWKENSDFLFGTPSQFI